MADYYIIGHFVLIISLDLMKSLEVRKAGERPSNAKNLYFIIIIIIIWPIY